MKFSHESAASRLRKGFDDHGDALTAADTGRGEPKAEIVTAQLVENRDHETRARSAERMTKGDGTAVHIGFVALEAENFFNGEVLRGEGFVKFDAIHLIECQARKL